jgi:hypothetical protein
MAGPIRTSILTSWGVPGLPSSNHFAPLRKECRMPRGNTKMWQEVLHAIVGDSVLKIGKPKD